MNIKPTVASTATTTNLSGLSDAELEKIAATGKAAQDILSAKSTARHNALVAMEDRIGDATYAVHNLMKSTMKELAPKLSTEGTAEASLLAYAKTKDSSALGFQEGETVVGPDKTRTIQLGGGGGFGTPVPFTQTDHDRTTQVPGLFTELHSAFSGNGDNRIISAKGTQGIKFEMTMPENNADVERLMGLVLDGKLYVGITVHDDAGKLKDRFAGPIASVPADLDLAKPLPEKNISQYDVAQAAAPMISGPSVVYPA